MGYDGTLAGDRYYWGNWDSLGVVSLADPENPKLIVEKKVTPDQIQHDDYPKAIAVKGGYLYVSYRWKIDVFGLTTGQDGTLNLELVGSRKATPLEYLLKISSNQLLVHGNKLIEAANNFGILVYDISEPTLIKRINHGGDRMIVRGIGFWKGHFFARGYMMPGSGLYFMDLKE
jgi:hypothetical protein